MAIKFFNKKEGFRKISSLAKSAEPFLFIISYNKEKIYAKALKDLDKSIKYSFNCQEPIKLKKRAKLKKFPIKLKEYKKAFNKVIEEIKLGNTYLLNLTFCTKIETSLSLKDIYLRANAPYKLLIDDSFVCFSPECFITIKDSKIATFPMKGTIDASIPNAKEKILSDLKESAEHTMIVDLMRNDLNMVAVKTNVPKFRYIDKIQAGDKELLQVSSKIEANLPNNWQESLGEILDKLTPAGSITGTPKRKTIEIIDNIELTPRGLYTGVFGIFDGENLQSAVMIRAISKKQSELFYHSGGGITIDSNVKMEYQELIDKVYLPI